MLERIRRGVRIEHYETVRQRKDGELIHVSLSVSPVKDGQGRIVGASKIARDITERKRSEAQRTLLINELNHRVKNTLATVRSLAMQTLRNTERSEDARPIFDARLTALSRAHDLLTARNWESALLGDVVERALQAFAGDGDRVSVSGPDVMSRRGRRWRWPSRCTNSPPMPPSMARCRTRTARSASTGLSAIESRARST
ncbi:MAG: HWE histidine kinase domain-containing protein [Hyphomonadaceae bacterium]